MEKDLEQIVQLVREYVHLNRNEIDGYLDGSLDSESLHAVEEHLRACAYCSEEVEIIADSQAEARLQEADATTRSDSERKGLLRRIADKWLSSRAEPSSAEQAVPEQPVLKGAYARLWLGDRCWNLEPVPGGLFEVERLSGQELAHAQKQDTKDPGARPLGIEGPGKAPIVLLLSVFERVGVFVRSQWHTPDTPPLILAAAHRFYVPSLPDAEEQETKRKMSARAHRSHTTERFASRKGPEREVILKGETQRHKVEFLLEKLSGKILVRIGEK